MQKTKKTIKVVAAIIFEGTSVYCFRKGQNKYDYLAYKFEFPGGKIEPNENKKQALKREILEAVQNPNNCVGFYVRRSFYFVGKNINYGGCQRDKVIRLFLKEECMYRGIVHEKITTNGKLGFFKHKIEHYSYKNYDHYISKMNHYGALRAKQYFDEGKTVNLYHILIKPPARFFIHYFLRLGFLDGFPGYIFAKTQAYGVYVRYVKLWLLNRNVK